MSFVLEMICSACSVGDCRYHQKLIKTKDDVKKGLLCVEIVDSSKEIKKSLRCMWESLDDLKQLKFNHQKEIFRKIFDSLNTKTFKHIKNSPILEELKNIRRNTSDTNVQQKLNPIIDHLYNEIQKPVKKNSLITKLIKTEQFSKDDAHKTLARLSSVIDGIVFVNENDVYPTNIGYSLSDS